MASNPHQCAPINQPEGRSRGAVAGISLPGRGGPRGSPLPRALAASQPGASGASVRQVVRCQARPSRGGLSQPPSYAAEPGQPARPPPPLSPGYPARGASSPPPRPERKPPRRGAGAPGLGAGGGRAALPELRAPRAPRAPRLQVRRPRRAGRVTAPPAWPPSGQQTRCGQPAGTGKEEALRLGPTGEDPASRRPGAPSARLASRAWRPSRAASTGGHGVGCAAWTRPVWEDRRRLGRGFSVLFRVNFQSAECWALVSAPWISLPRVGV